MTRLGGIKQSMRQSSLGRNAFEKLGGNVLVLSAAALHRQAGVQKIMDPVCTENCSAGILKMSPNDTFKAEQVEWLQLREK